MSQQDAAHSTDVPAHGSTPTHHAPRAASTSSTPGADGVCNTHVQPKVPLLARNVHSHAGCTQHRDWADLDSDDDLDSVPESNRSTEADSAAPDKAPAQASGLPSLTETLTHSLLIQSFSGNSQANSSMGTERLSPAQSDSPSAVVWQPSSTTVGFNPLTTVPEAGFSAEEASPARRPSIPGARISVPIATPQNHTHGYAGLLGAFGKDEQGSSDVHSPVLQAVSDAHSDPEMRTTLLDVSAGLDAGSRPEAALEGMGGTYFMRDAAGRCAAMFKPCDEEPLAPNNPKQWQGRDMGAPGMKPSVRVGEAALREVAAYLLDHDSFAGVPAACLAKCYHPAFNYKVQVPRIVSLRSVAALPAEPHSFGLSSSGAANADFAPACDVARGSLGSAGAAAASASNAVEVSAGSAGGLSRVFSRKTPPLPAHSTDPAIAPVAPTAPGVRKLGSLQRFVPSKCDANDMSPSYFAADNVHRIGLLDLRLFNCDRHTGNLLVQEAPRQSAAVRAFPRGAPYTVVPIDHGYALPEALDNPYFEWLYWPQTSVPFSEEAKAYVAALDAQGDVDALRAKLPQLREECLRCLQTTTTVLKLCVAAGLTLFEIGSIFTRPEGAYTNGQVPSDLEAMCMDAREEALATAGSPDPDSSGNTSPSQPGSPVSFGLNIHSANTLPAVEEIDSDEESSCFFNISATGEDLRSPRGCDGGSAAAADTAETSPLMFAMTPREGVSIGGAHGGNSAFSGARGSANGAAAPLDTPPMPGMHSDHARFASMPFASHSFGRRNVTSHDGDTTPTPVAAQSASGVAVSQGPATWGRRGLPRSRRNAWRSKHGAQRNMGAYPALLPGTHPDQVNYVFSDLSEAQWRTFMSKLEEYVETELGNCTWKAQRVTGCMAGSCPIAFDKHMR